MQQTIYLKPDTRENLEKIAEFHNISMSAIIAYLINKEHQEKIESDEVK